jgi:ABC-type multidrug transport system fused ATPase/permease subunit
MTLTVLNWAYLALFLAIDRGLVAVVDDDRWKAHETLTGLEDKSEEMFRIYRDVRKARVRLDSVLNDLGGGELALWQKIADVQKFGELISAVDSKVELLQLISERRVTKAAADSARRTSNVLGSLTALTVVTVAIAVVGGLFGTPASAIDFVWRIPIVLVAFALAFALYRAAQAGIRERERRLRVRLARRPRRMSA